MKNLGRRTKATACYGVTTTPANSTLYGDAIDMAEYDGCLFSALFKSTAASTGAAIFSVKGATSSTVAAAAYNTINGATATISKSTTANAKRLVQVDVDKSRYRYLRALVAKTSHLILEGVIAQQYGGPYQPASTGTSTNVLTVAAT
jgi:hypothetical protein